MSSFASRFLHENYGVMRHARDIYGGTEIDPSSAQSCANGMGYLADIIRGRKVTIFHSPLTRAMLTARIAHDALVREGIEVVSVKCLEWLRSDSYGLNNENIATVCKDDPTTFTLFITHVPDIRRYCDRGSDFTPKNNLIIAKTFSI